MKRARILLADDHTLILEGFRTILQPYHEIVGAVTDGRALLNAALSLKPDLIVLDVTMPLLNGIDAARQIRKALPGVKFVFVTMHINPAYLRAALEVGASGYVLKSSAREEILQAIEEAMKGHLYVSAALSSEQLKFFRNPQKAAEALRLSAREREVLQLIAEGYAAKGIASVLNIATKTAEYHRDNLKKKLGLRSTAELTRYAISEGLVEPPSLRAPPHSS
jgi:DNA-binding NarL/FixJ family response regulator